MLLADTITIEDALTVGMAVVAVAAVLFGGGGMVWGRSIGRTRARADLRADLDYRERRDTHVSAIDARLRGREQSVEIREADVARREDAADFAAQAARVKRQRRELDGRAAELAARAEELDRLAATLAARVADVDQRDAELAGELARVERREQAHERALQALHVGDLPERLTAARSWLHEVEALTEPEYAALQAERIEELRRQTEQAHDAATYDPVAWQAAANAVAQLGQTLAESRELASAEYEAVKAELGRTTGGKP